MKRMVLLALAAGMVCLLSLGGFSSAGAENIPSSTPLKSGTSAQERLAEERLMDDLYDEADSAGPEIQRIPDPLIHLNMVVFAVNDAVYDLALTPVSTGYREVLPHPVRQGVANFFDNLMFPVRFINNLFQGKTRHAGTELRVFLINSTEGLLGVMQPAQKKYHLQTYDEDLGQSLGYHKVGEGCYLVLPILGPSCLRDAAGRAGDSLLSPLRYVRPWERSAGLNALDTVNDASFRIGDYESLKAAAIDPYQAFKNAYIQNRRYRIQE